MKNSVCSILVVSFLISCQERHERTILESDSEAIVGDANLSFLWYDDLCEYKGTFDSKKYTKRQLNDTYDLWSKHRGVCLSTDATADKIEDFFKLDAEKLTREYNETKTLYQSLRLVDLPFWKKMKQQREKALEDEYELKMITIEAYSNPKILLNNRFYGDCKEYADALASGDNSLLLKTWRNYAEKAKLNNGSPEVFMKKFEAMYQSKDSLLYAKLELMKYGWWNCANNMIQYDVDDEAVFKEYDNLFIKITSECDEP
jgi:hypothetical protein